MMGRKILEIIVLGSLLGLSSNRIVSAESGQPSAQVQEQYNSEKIFGEIISIDEDSFVMDSPYKGANFEFEHMRIKTQDGKTYKLIFPGPSNYEVGDKIEFKYLPKSKIFYDDLIEESWGKNADYFFPLQNGYFDADGIIKRDKK